MARNDSGALLREALEAGGARDYARAAELLTRIVSETDEYPEALLYLGRSLHALGDFEKAIGAFRLYLGTEKDPAPGWFFLGRSYLAIRRPQEAARSLRKALELGADGAEPWAFLGLAALRLRKSKAAVEALEKAVSLAPDNSRIFPAI
jgi:cytochrome c-type biogenesis protein CcmH/NrfG